MTALVVVLAVALAVSAGVIATLVTRVRALESAAQSTPAPVPAAAEDPTDGSLPRLVAALDALSLGVVVADADEVLGFQNRSAQAILSSRDARTIINRAVRELLVAAVRGEPGEREIDLFGPPKSTYLIRAVPLGNGVAVGGGSVAVIEDVTERRRTDQVRRDFVSNISHELKTPVGAVGLLAETLRDETDLATIRRFSERMSLEVARLSRTIDDLLELSRIEFADDLFIDETRVGDIVEDALGRFRAAADARGITLKSVGESGIVVAGDRRQITSALGNLIDNAVKYSPDGAPVDVIVDGTRVEVRDHGNGIADADLPRIFDRFYRATEARTAPGSGLGLAIVNQIIECVTGSDYEYPDGTPMTMGVISLFGPEQAKLIQNRLLAELDSATLTDRRIHVGDASDFQGDERDVIFLSMVKTPNGNGTRLSKLGHDRDSRRFNVAASRARDQLWLFHSVTLDDLNPDCPRARLITHMDHPGLEGLVGYEAAVDTDRLTPPFESLFEQRVFMDLVNHGFVVRPQWKVLGYRLDLVVVGADAEALDLVLDAGEAGEDQNGGLDLRHPKLLEHVVAGHVGQVEVEKDNVVVVKLAEIDAFLSEIRRIDVEALGFQHQFDRLRDGAVIFYQQNAHASSP